MNMLYAPWREEYTNNIHDQSDSTFCVFCEILTLNDDENYFILTRYKTIACMLNRYPYAAGHLLLVPFAHKSNLEELSESSRQEIMYLTNQAVSILKKELEAEGINVGINLGKAAGAGIPHHLHVHILPRWTGDTNFLPTLANTKQVSKDLALMYQKLKPAFKALTLLD